MNKIEKVSVTELTTRAIRNSILAGEYKVGDKLSTEIMLCQQLNVSRTVVREALRILATEGYIRMIPGRGAFVARVTKIDKDDYWGSFSSGSFRDLMDVRMPLEEIAARLAVQRGGPELVEALEANFDAFIEADDACDRQALVKLDEQFHMTIFKASGNALLLDIGKMLTKAFNEYRYASFNDDGTYANAIEPHRRLIAAFKNQSEEEAVEAMHYHMLRAVEDISTRIRSDE